MKQKMFDSLAKAEEFANRKNGRIKLKSIPEGIQVNIYWIVEYEEG